MESPLSSQASAVEFGGAQVSTVAVSVQLVGCRYVGLPRYVRLMFRAAPGYLKVTAVSLARPFVYRGNSEEGVCDCSPQ